MLQIANEHSEGCSHTDQSSDKPLNCMIPKRAILTREDLDRFTESATHNSYMSFISDLSDSVLGKTLTQNVFRSNTIVLIMNLLETLQSWCDEIEAAPEGTSRFGNVAFQTWYDKLASNAETMLQNISPRWCVPEIAIYLIHSFGNRKRIDYGTGHEANFMAFLLCLKTVGVITVEDYPALVLGVHFI